ncbi:hypothetical protein BESB_021580 [Besnoitia besnoiti]|uniref:Uncharacterized protein n=1 Tax=Besnoitia besnoiti TaxID=94643 RepID=A0A2A9M9C3_BESBE|nr:hypothetical protein BESB_021580 [Besnoitia besnoiti]PFH32217.1 hypothetical protein BESB_021580 [Besnoitia besnoiti]
MAPPSERRNRLKKGKKAGSESLRGRRLAELQRDSLDCNAAEALQGPAAERPTEEQKRAAAEAKLRAMCAAFWGDEDGEIVPASSSVASAASAAEEGCRAKCRRGAESAADTAGVSSLPADRAADSEELMETSCWKKPRRKDKSAQRGVAGCALSSSASDSIEHILDADFLLPCKKRRKGDEKERPINSSDVGGSASPNAPAPVSARDDSTAQARGDRASAQRHSAGKGAPASSAGRGSGLFGRRDKGEGPPGGESAAEKARRTREEEAERKARTMFDETVRDIRKLVYPHLGTFQRRQYFSAALRALGAKKLKGQRMPLPELRSRQARTKENIAKRLEEERHLGVSTHLDRRGYLQAAERHKKHQREQKRSRQHVRSALGSAGRLDKQQMKKLRVKASS